MNEFQFQAVAAHDGHPVEVEVFLEDGSHGYTPRHAGGALVFRRPDDQPQRWYAMTWGRRVATGRSAGGSVIVEVDPRKADGKVHETTPTRRSTPPSGRFRGEARSLNLSPQGR